MPRPKKPEYEYVPALGRYRKRIKDADGKYVAIYGTTPEELAAKLEEVRQQIEKAAYRRENPTVAAYAEKWLSLLAPHVKFGTLTDYQYVVKHYIIAPPLGPMLLRDVTTDDVAQAAGIAAGRSQSVYRKAVMLLQRIFDSAVDSGLLDSSPCKKIKARGGKPPKERQALTDVQI